ncbi:mechanosensitive ion channel family protein [Aurantivibrio infirmus]
MEIFLDTIYTAWNFEISSFDGKTITVGSIVLAFLLAFIGLILSRYLSSLTSRIVTRRLKCDEGASVAIKTITFYILLCSFTLLALKAVNFPLAVFTVLGGAMAIGIGFGSQNVMNNFISGLILLIERPVRPQDVVEIEGSHGVIEHIGARSTQIRSTDGRHIVVPNSFFLQNNLINWTLSDDLIRTKVTVGVAYGSDPHLVEKCILKCINDEEGVHMDPPPNVIFDDFAESSLNFDVYFWLHARSPMSIRKIQSRLRFSIERSFRENNIVIAFPQRDVHLNLVRPLDINLTNNSNSIKENENIVSG